MGLLRNNQTGLAATILLLGGAILGADAFAGCGSVDEQAPTASASSSSKSSSSAGGATTSTTSAGGGGTMTTTTTGTGGTGGAGGAGGAGGMVSNCTQDTGGDTCPGDTIPLSTDTIACYAGDLTTAKNDYSSMFCNNLEATNGPDRVYHLTFKQVGSLKVVVKAINKDFDPTLHVRANPTQVADCTKDDFTCFYFFPTQEGVAAEIDPAIFPDLYAVVDAANMKAGKYEMSISFTAPKCGDGVLNGSTKEECDDGNTTSGDGCDKGCKLETISVFDSCPGEPFLIGANQSLILTSNTAPYKDGDGTHSYKPKAMGTCGAAATNSTAKDRVYQVKAQADGTLTASVGYDVTGTIAVCDQDILDPGCWDMVLYAVDALNTDTCGASCTCADAGGNLAGAQLACSNQGVFGTEQISFPVKKAHSYFLIVDGNSQAAKSFGSFNLQVSLK